MIRSWLLALSLLAALAPRIAPRGPVVVFAAASMKTSLDALQEPIRQATGVTIAASYASSAVLARQIEALAPADVFISADLDWMDYVDQRHLLRADSRSNLLGNALVLIAPKASAAPIAIAPNFPLAAALGGGRLAIGEPTSVPAGKYAKAALTSLGVWASVAPHLAPADNVRVALTLVSRGDAPLGVVYKTDAIADPSVAIVGTFPPTSHPPIVYPIALTNTAAPDAAKVLAFLKSTAAFAVFEKYGFTAPPK